jgi:hypothetical protein
MFDDFTFNCSLVIVAQWNWRVGNPLFSRKALVLLTYSLFANSE